jgi:MAP/microtubule affinity-regulating kinase
MKDKWMNVNYENDELKPYEEPSQDFNDNYRIGISHYLIKIKKI